MPAVASQTCETCNRQEKLTIERRKFDMQIWHQGSVEIMRETQMQTMGTKAGTGTCWSQSVVDKNGSTTRGHSTAYESAQQLKEDETRNV